MNQSDVVRSPVLEKINVLDLSDSHLADRAGQALEHVSPDMSLRQLFLRTYAMTNLMEKHLQRELFCRVATNASEDTRR